MNWRPGLLALVLLFHTFAFVAASADDAKAYVSAVLVEGSTGRVLFEDNAHESRAVASMTKMMTLLLVMEAVESGAVKLDDPVTITKKAEDEGGSQVFLARGGNFTVRQLVAAALIHSANDAAMALAEHVSGSESAFVARMNQRAAALGMSESRFFSPNGLPSTKRPDDVMSADDAAKLAVKLMKFPVIRQYAATTEMEFHNGTFAKLQTTNKLLGSFPGANGLKTGYHRAAGFCITASAERGDLHLIAVIMGSTVRDASFDSAAALLRRGFDEWRWAQPLKKGQRMRDPVVVKGGEVSTVTVAAASAPKLLLHRNEARRLVTAVTSDGAKAPIRKGEKVGAIVVTLDGKTLASVPALSDNDVAAASWWQRLIGF
ncbi:MAG: D-alanyl-D-alanine carboxypeptidase family protein [Thermoanaerobaculia bacterium]|jgi:D-alanyl-D-alanine carboxypeptidase (penicillin-binding protein 5/6)